MTDEELKDLMQEDASEAETVPEEETDDALQESEEDDKSMRKKELKAALEQKEKELAEQKDQHLRLMAEYQNYRNRTTEEKKKIYGDAKADCIRELLDVADTFDRAMEAECADETYKKGVELTYGKFQKALEKLGITAFSPLGEEFDPNLHNAIRQVEDGDFEENTVCEVYQKGYVLGDRLIRPAVVAVKA
ncbi:MAG: nucleotide exchange factor GrpE [Ruminococcus sp.]|nr:nucleotide exchange factor GrpE [Ruminococcus sp.]